MSNIYITEPPSKGKVVLETSRGEIDVELFADQCPLACKNFISLALEGYYDDIVWHRYVRDFIIQTGDPTGTGVGGESIYGHEFADEPHQRLRFNRRGLLGMANGTDRNTNGSQFFLTLGATPELQGKHTMFGRVTTATIYNLVALADSVGEVGQDDRPLYPPKLKTVRVVENPFEGQLQLRITREERLAMKKNRKEAQQRKGQRGEGAAGRKTKNKSLLSFGDEEADEDGDELVSLKGPKSSHDLLKNDKRLRKEAYTKTVKEQDSELDLGGSAARRTTETGDGTRERSPSSDVRQKPTESAHQHTSDSPGSTLTKAEAPIRGQNNSKDQDSHPPTSAKAKVKGQGRDWLEEYQAKYKKPKQRHEKRDDETFALLKSFQQRSKRAHEATRTISSVLDTTTTDEVPDEMREYGEGESDDDKSWRGHRLDFGGKAMHQDQHDHDEYVTLDPRDSSSASAVRLGFGGQEGQDRAREQRAKEGRRGRDWVDERQWKGNGSSSRGSGHSSRHAHDYDRDKARR